MVAEEISCFVELLGEYRRLKKTGNHEREYAKLINEARRIFVKAISWMVGKDNAEDLAQDKILKVLGYILDTDHKPDYAEKYLYRSAKNAAIDYIRKCKRMKTVPAENVNQLSRYEQELMAQRCSVDEEKLQVLKQKVKEAINNPSMPKSYRRVLEEHYLKGVPIGTLAEQELAANPITRDGNPRSLTTARNTVDKRLERARKWLKQAVVQKPVE